MQTVKLFKPFVSWWAIWNVVRVLRSGYIAEGPEVKAFEQEFKEKFKLSHDVIALNSGTSALELAYELAGIGEGDEVVTPVFPFVGTNIPLIRRRAKIVFADIDRDMNVSVDDVRDKITSQTKALVFVHFAGNSRGLKEMRALADEHKISLIEDAAQALGSDEWGIGDFVCVSLQAIKTLTTGDGGFLICKDDKLAEKARRLRWFGFDRPKRQKTGDSDVREAGYKYHMNDIAAAIGRGNLKVIDKIITHRKRLIAAYRGGGVEHAYIWIAYTFTHEREKLRAYLQERGIETGIHHFRNDAYTLFGGRQRLSMMDELENAYIILPLHMGMSVGDVQHICNLIGQFNSMRPGHRNINAPTFSLTI